MFDLKVIKEPAFWNQEVGCWDQERGPLFRYFNVNSGQKKKKKKEPETGETYTGSICWLTFSILWTKVWSHLSQDQPFWSNLKSVKMSLQ